MLTLATGIDTPLHRWPAGVKLALLALATMALFPLGSVPVLAAAALATGAAYLACGSAFARRGLALLRPLWPFLLVLALWHWWIAAPREGMVIGLRMVTLVAMANLVTLTTRLDDLVAVVERLARPLARLGLPPRRLALAMALVIRFVPVMLWRSAQLAQAWRARSARRPGWLLILPAVLAALDNADHLADALRARGGL